MKRLRNEQEKKKNLNRSESATEEESKDGKTAAEVDNEYEEKAFEVLNDDAFC